MTYLLSIGALSPINLDGLKRFVSLTESRWANTRAEFDSSGVVPQEVIHSLLKAMQAAPSGFNVQPYRCIVVQGADAKQR